MDRLVPLAASLRNATEQNLQPTQVSLPNSYRSEAEARGDEPVPNLHAVAPEKTLIRASEEPHDGRNPYDDLARSLLEHGQDKNDFSDSENLRYTVVEESTFRTKISDRVAPTLVSAKEEKHKYATRAMWTGYILNAAIGLQVLAGALITAIAAGTSGKQSSMAITALGGLTTVVASYLARVRGSGEPELSIARIRDLEQFLRDAESFILDHGEEYGAPGDKLDEQVIGFRRHFELLLGNSPK